MLKAIIFDCDGVIADTEPIHLEAFARVLAEEGISLTREDYFAHYLALDDRHCFIKLFADRGIDLTSALTDEMINRKAEYVEAVMRSGLQILPGAAELIRLCAERYPLAIASGALKPEVNLVVNYGGLTDCFRAIVTAEDVTRSKPYPDPFVKALDFLNLQSAERIEPVDCLVIEDSIHGVQAAHSASMRCLAVTTSYPKEKLHEADLVVNSLSELSLSDLEALFDS